MGSGEGASFLLLSIGDPAGVRSGAGFLLLSIGDPAGVRSGAGFLLLSLGDPAGVRSGAGFLLLSLGDPAGVRSGDGFLLGCGIPLLQFSAYYLFCKRPLNAKIVVLQAHTAQSRLAQVNRSRSLE